MYNYMQEMKCINELRKNETDENLWNCVVAFQGHTFHTYSGLEFSYTLKRGRDGEYTRELWGDKG